MSRERGQERVVQDEAAASRHPRRSGPASLALVAILLLWPPSPALAVTYAYDELGRLLEADYGAGRRIVYAYDEAGNPTAQEVTWRDPLALPVCPTCLHTTLQAAVDAAAPGDRILLPSGTVRGGLLVDGFSDVTIEGGWSADFGTRSADPALTVLSGDADGDGDGDGSAVLVRANAGERPVLRLDGLTVSGGRAASGGGISVTASGQGRAHLALERVVVRGNSVTGRGGGLALESSGGGAATLDAVNALVHSNSAVEGGGLAVRASGAGSRSAASLVNVTLAGNTASRGGGVSTAALTDGAAEAAAVNSILWGNAAKTGADALLSQSGGATHFVTASSDVGIVARGVAPYARAADDLNLDPIFVNPWRGDFHLHVPSRVQNRADALYAPDADFEGDARPQGPGSDMGADERVSRSVSRLRVLAPAGGESLKDGTVVNINWEAPTGVVKFEPGYSLDRGRTWKDLPRTGNVRTARWTVPTVRSKVTTARVRVRGYNAAGRLLGSDASDRNFTIQP